MGVLIPNHECVEDFSSPPRYYFRFHMEIPVTDAQGTPDSVKWKEIRDAVKTFVEANDTVAITKERDKNQLAIETDALTASKKKLKGLLEDAIGRVPDAHHPGCDKGKAKQWVQRLLQ